MTTVFHRGEILIQTESGVDQRAHKMGNKLIRDHIIEQHKEFFENLPYAFISLHDNEGRPWISLIQGDQGFINSPDPKTLNLNGNIVAKDALHLQTGPTDPVGLVGLDLSNRRRNRLNGNFKRTSIDDTLSIAVGHSFGNCPKYIQLRSLETATGSHSRVDNQQNAEQYFDKLNENDIKIITDADTLFIGSSEEQGGDLDASHRGGKPGFVHVDSDQQLWFNDYPGNNFFQTFGNIQRYPYVGLMFIDFDSGDLLLLSGQSRLEQLAHTDSNENKKLNFLPRRFCFTLEKGIRIQRAIRGSWSTVEMSPFLDNITD